MSDEFKEKLLLYKTGKLSETDALEIRQEIDKYLAISDFLDDESIIKLPTDTSPVGSTQIKSLKRKLNIRYLLISVFLLLSLVLASFTIYNISENLITNFYPDLSKFKDGTVRIDREMNLYVTTFLPETYRIVDMRLDKNLFARYSTKLVYSKSLMNTKLDILQLNLDYSMGKPIENKAYRMVDGKFFDAVAWENRFYLTNSSNKYGFIYRDKEGFKVLESLPKGVQAEVWLAFNKSVPASEISELLNITSDSKYSICFTAIDTGFTPPQQVNAISAEGFNVKLVFGLRMQNLIDISKIDGTAMYTGKPTQDWINANYLSLLTHMQKRQDAIRILFEDSSGMTGFNLDLTNRIEYIRNNGVNCIGVALVGNAEEILKLKDNPLIFGSEVKNVAVW